MDNLMVFLEKVAAKLDVPINMLWGSLMKQAFISSMIDSAIFIMSLILLFIFGNKMFNKYNEWDNVCSGGKIFMVGFCIVILTFIVFAQLCMLPVTISGFVNPEYWSLHELAGFFKTK